MNTPFIISVVLVFNIFGFVLYVQSEELLSYNEVTASTPDDYHCGPNAKIRLDASSEENYRKSRVDMQRMSEIVRTYLWLDCKEIEFIEFEAYAEGTETPVYKASIEKKSEWFLKEKALDQPEEKDSKEVEDKNKQKVEPNETIDEQPSFAKTKAEPALSNQKGKYSSLDDLESEAKTSEKAQLELAKGLLDLPGKPTSIDFPEDQAEKGLEILETLASNGNADAMQILSEAYSSDKKFTLNIPLIESLTGRPMTQNKGAEQRGSASASLTLEAAANGSELAVDALEEAGRAGSNMSYYALGMMYLLDKANKMPYEQEFLSEELNFDIAGSGGQGNVDVGLHFLSLAAEGGNADAQELLTDMEVDFNTPSSSSGSSPSLSQAQASSISQAANAAAVNTQALNSGNNSAGSAPSSYSSQIAETEELIGSGALSDILDARSKANTVSSSTANQTQNSAATSGGAASSSGSGLASAPGRSNPNANSATSGKNVSRSSRRSAVLNQRQGQSSPGNMNTEQNEAEIID